MSRYVSFAVLLGVIALLSILFYKILSGFLVPLFLAALLVVIFRPVHDRLLVYCNGREKLAALLTTLSVLLVVLVPLGIVITLAIFEGKDAIANFNVEDVKNKARQVRSNLGWEYPAAPEIREVEREFSKMRESWSFEDLEYHSELWYSIGQFSKSILKKYPWLDETDDEVETVDPAKDRQRFAWADFMELLESSKLDCYRVKEMEQSYQDMVNDDGEAVRIDRSEALSKYHQKVNKASVAFNQLKYALAGGRWKANIKMVLNPDLDQLSEFSASTVDFFQGRLLSLGGATTSFVGKTLVGVAIMILALYFFLLDGARMIEAFQGLSPLDDEHERELVREFDKVSRAVVIATLLSAVVQGLLAGIGFYFCGFESIFLLTMLTTAMALVPFVGAASVWVPASLYLYLFQDNLTAAIGLAIYGVAIISMADNVIKPLVLHGQSKLHPLFALLSVLGGISALGPIGLLVGPMVVAFLQTMLKILQRELTQMEDSENAARAVS